jgi:hypothetical protein
VDDAGWEMDEGGCPVTPERLDYLANLYAGHSPATELVAEIRRLWKAMEAAAHLQNYTSEGPLEDIDAILDPDQPGDIGWRHGFSDARTKLRDALAAYDAAADRHPGQMGLGDTQ